MTLTVSVLDEYLTNVNTHVRVTDVDVAASKTRATENLRVVCLCNGLGEE